MLAVYEILLWRDFRGQFVVDNSVVTPMPVSNDVSNGEIVNQNLNCVKQPLFSLPSPCGRMLEHRVFRHVHIECREGTTHYSVAIL